MVTFLWLGLWAYIALRYLALGVRKSILFVFPIHFALCGVPLLLDVIVGVPFYLGYPGFRSAGLDETTAILYCAYVSTCPIIWWFFAGGLRKTSIFPAIHSRRMTKLALLVMLMLPGFLVLLSPDPFVYSEYSIRVPEPSTAHLSMFFHIWVVQSIQFSILAAGIILIRAKRVWACILWLAPVIFSDCWLHGKRNAVAIALAMLLYALWRRGILTRKRLYVVGATAFLCLFAFSFYYIGKVRYSSKFLAKQSYEFFYDFLRMDYGRDAVIKLVIFAELYPERIRILDYRGQSAVIIATVWYPRPFWPSKPESFGTHVTTAAMHGPSPGGGSTTTSVLAEAIANLSWFGWLIGPLILSLVCRIGDSCNDEIIFALTLLIIVFLQTVHIAPWAVVAFVWSILVFWKKVLNRFLREVVHQETLRHRRLNEQILPEFV